MVEDIKFIPIKKYNFKNEFVCDGIKTRFQLSNIATEIVSVYVDGTEVSNYTFDLEADTIIMSSAPSNNSTLIVHYLADLSYAQGPARLASAVDISKDEDGITKPNLHRRIDNELTGDTSMDFHEEKFIGDGTTKTFKLQNHSNIGKVVEVTVNNAEVEYTFNSSNKVTLTSAPSADSLIRIVYYIIIPNVSPDQYSLFVEGLNSFRGVEHFYYDENSTTSEIP